MHNINMPNLVSIVFIGLCLLAEYDAKDLPAGVDEEAYCVACETMSTLIFKRLSTPDLKDRTQRIESILRTICSSGNFNSVVEYPPRDLVKACKHIMQARRKPITSSIESVLSSTGSQAELTQAMCHISSDACRDVRTPAHINKVETISEDSTLDAIEAYIKAHDGVKKVAGYQRKDEL